MRLILKILAAPLVVALTLFVWICTIFLYCTGMVLGLAALVVALLGVAVLVTYSLQNGIILLVIAVLISPMGLPTAAACLPTTISPASISPDSMRDAPSLSVHRRADLIWQTSCGCTSIRPSEP